MVKNKKDVLKFNKEQIIKSDKYAKRRDLLSFKLEEGKQYTFKQVDKIISDFMKGKVK